MHGFIPVADMNRRFDAGMRARLPFHQPLLEAFRRCDPALDIGFALRLVSNRRLWKGAFNLVDGHLFAGGVHQEVGVVDHRELDRNLLKLLHRVVVEGFCPLADLARGQVDAIGERVANPFAANNYFQKVEEALRACRRKVRQILAGQNACFIELDGKGHHLRRRIGIQAVLLRESDDVVVEFQILHRRHGVGQFAVALLKIGTPARIIDRLMAIFGTVVTTIPAHPQLVFQGEPGFFAFLAPEILAPSTRIAPGKIVNVKFITLAVRHGVASVRVVVNFLNHAVADLKQFGRLGYVGILGTANRDGLESLVAHDHANPA